MERVKSHTVPSFEVLNRFDNNNDIDERCKRPKYSAFFFIFLFLDTIWEIMFRYRGESQMFTFHISHHCIITPFEFHLKFSSDSMVKWRNNIFDGRFDFFYFFLYFPFYCHSIAHCLATLSVWIHSSIWIMNVTMLC